MSTDSPRRDTQDTWLDRALNVLGMKPAASMREDLQDALEAANPPLDDGFSAEEKRILRNLLAARDRRVQDVMIPRGAIIAVAETTTITRLKQIFAEAGHSRLPVYGETLDDAKGMIHLRDMFASLEHLAPDLRLADSKLVRPVLFSPGGKRALELMAEMQAKHIHMALVIDEYGATDGLVSHEDLAEMILGQIEDEHDEAEDPHVFWRNPHRLEINAQAELALVSDLTHLVFEPLGEEHEISTIGGYISALEGSVPAMGAEIEGMEGVRFVVLAADSRRLKRIAVVLPEGSGDTG